MFKVLFKKQLLEISRGFFQNSKTGKRRSKTGIVGTIVVYFLLIGLIFFGVFTMAKSTCEFLCANSLVWLYFAIVSVLAIFLGVFGSVFNTYSATFLAKDNDLLLSMPIRPSDILKVRFIGVYVTGAIYTAAVFLPSYLAYLIYAQPTITSVLTSMLLFFDLTLAVAALSCAFGFLVAVISVKIKRKSIVSVVAAIVFLAIYYFISFKSTDFIEDILANGEEFAAGVKLYAYPLYAFGKVGEGSLIFAGACTAILLVVFVCVYLLLKRSFLKISTIKGGAVKRVRGKIAKRKSVSAALISREFKRYFSSAAYILNCSMSSVLMTAFAVFVFIKANDIRNIISGLNVGDVLAPIISGIIAIFASMNYLCAPSVSLEGKTLYLLKSFPIKTSKILKSKIELHIILTLPPVLFLSVALCYAVNLSVGLAVLVVFVNTCFTVLVAEFDLMMGLIFPNFSYTNESVAVKQGTAVFLSMCGGWAITAAFVGIFFLFNCFSSKIISFVIIAVAVFISAAALGLLVFSKGVKIFEKL